MIMLCYYDPSMLTCEEIQLKTKKEGRYQTEIDTGELYLSGYKSATLDGFPYPVSSPRGTCLYDINPNGLYLTLYKNTGDKKWLSKIDKGLLLIPIAMTADRTEIPKRLVKKGHPLAFINREDFMKFDKSGNYTDYRLVFADRDETYSLNGKIII